MEAQNFVFLAYSWQSPVVSERDTVVASKEAMMLLMLASSEFLKKQL